MGLNRVEIAEKVADQYAFEFIRDYTGEEVFLGSDIEQLLSEKAYVIFQTVDDPKYFGAAVYLKNKHLIAINTNQSLRMRYYSAAHELWHLQYEAGEIPLAEISDFDHERAADHFAAAVMMPQKIMLSLAQHLNENHSVLIIKIADLSSMPYVAVVRRLQELGKRFPKNISLRTEEEWINIRKSIGITSSILDRADAMAEFPAMSKRVGELVSRQEITLEVAANLLRHTAPSQSEEYWAKRRKLAEEWIESDD